ncbi:DUF3298 domain-containing protein [[Mycobacterium] crassicus]|uniref:DUF3298 domain-containing protein n=1 Tax=[Mycobacterium] crassicus TaxID=2872309 RepID=A0ABU5XIM2_9MYCO|nr:DUF3298 domain-containing protein [Mycolicibacter sp. MYC098]MEB3021152.1 DUF3298 domain-containing protein [Mycolicibacter sp. MYC098]
MNVIKPGALFLALLALGGTAVTNVARAETSEAVISTASPDGLGTATVHYQRLGTADSPTAETINEHIDAEANRAVTQAMWNGSTRRPWTFDASGTLKTWAITVSEVFTGVYNTAEPHMPMRSLGSVVCDTRSGVVITWDNLFRDKTAGLTRLGEQLEAQVATVASPTELRSWRRAGQFAPVDVNFKYWTPTPEGIALQIPEVQFGRGLKVVTIPWAAVSDLIAPGFLPITG